MTLPTTYSTLAFPGLLALLLCSNCAIAAQSETATTPPLNLDSVSQYVKRGLREVDHVAQDNPVAQADTAFSGEGSNFEKAVNDASATATPRWNEPARIGKLPSIDGTKVYKITTPLGSYCVRNKGNGSKQSRVSCSTFNF